MSTCTCNDLFAPLLAFFVIVVSAVLVSAVQQKRKKRRETSFKAKLEHVERIRLEEVAPKKPVPVSAVEGSVIQKLTKNLNLRTGNGPPTAEQTAWSIPFHELQLGKRIGSGNVGVVHEGEWHGTKVALKKLVGTWVKDTDMVSRFREEINLMSTLHHPNVLMFIGAVMDPDAGNICLVTELCVKGDLYTHLHDPETRMTWKRRLIMATDVARGMLYLHRRAGIIQRDLKSANCLIDEHLHIKIADFGLSRRLAPGNMETYCGTPANMAPEIVKQEDYSEKADVFSFAIILWELVTGENPYPTLSGMALAFAVANRGLRPEIPSYCPAEIASMIERCWHHSPEQRPSFQEVFEELQTLQGFIRKIRTQRGDSSGRSEGQTSTADTLSKRSGSSSKQASHREASDFAASISQSTGTRTSLADVDDGEVDGNRVDLAAIDNFQNDIVEQAIKYQSERGSRVSLEDVRLSPHDVSSVISANVSPVSAAAGERHGPGGVTGLMSHRLSSEVKESDDEEEDEQRKQQRKKGEEQKQTLVQQQQQQQEQEQQQHQQQSQDQDTGGRMGRRRVSLSDVLEVEGQTHAQMMKAASDAYEAAQREAERNSLGGRK